MKLDININVNFVKKAYDELDQIAKANDLSIRDLLAKWVNVINVILKKEK